MNISIKCLYLFCKSFSFPLGGGWGSAVRFRALWQQELKHGEQGAGNDVTHGLVGPIGSPWPSVKAAETKDENSIKK